MAALSDTTRFENAPAPATAKDPFWIVGHRGSPIAEVENTFPSFIRAVDEGANAIEIDVSITRDDALVLWHDDDPDEYRSRFRQWGLEPYVGHRPCAPIYGPFRRPTCNLTLEELRRHYGYAPKNLMSRRVECEIPTFDGVIEWACRERRLGLIFVDVKIPLERIELVPRFLARFDQITQRLRPGCRLVLESAVPEVVAEIRRKVTKYEVVLDVEPHAGIVFDLEACSAVRAAIRHGLKHAVAQKPRSITLWPFATHRKIIERDLALLRDHNREYPHRKIEGICAFLINHPHEMRSLLDLGVSAIQTDFPAVLRGIALDRGRALEPRPRAERDTPRRSPASPLRGVS